MTFWFARTENNGKRFCRILLLLTTIRFSVFLPLSSDICECGISEMKLVIYLQIGVIGFEECGNKRLKLTKQQIIGNVF